MPGRSSMRTIREVLRLKWQAGLSNRQIASSCSIAHSTVGDYITKAEAAGLSWPLPEDLDDAILEKMLYPVPAAPQTAQKAMPSMQYLYNELKRKGVTWASITVSVAIQTIPRQIYDGGAEIDRDSLSSGEISIGIDLKRIVRLTVRKTKCMQARLRTCPAVFSTFAHSRFACTTLSM